MAVLGGKTQEGEQGSKSVPLLLSVRNPQIGYPSFCCDDVNHPQALIYEPSPKRLKLVGVEFITDAARGLRTTNNQSPVLEGSGFSARRQPERVCHPQPFYEFHVWACWDNPHGAFVDWNDHVTCAHNE